MGWRVVTNGLVLASTCLAFAGADATRYALVIGIGKYQNMGALPTCTNDARALARVLERQAGFDRVVLMVDDAEQEQNRPTMGNILNRLQQFAALPGPEDTVLVFYSGHGTIIRAQDAGGQETEEGYLVPADGSLRLAIPLRGAPPKRPGLIDSLAGCKAQTKLLILDCCHAGTSIKGVAGIANSLSQRAPEFLMLLSCGPDQHSYFTEKRDHSLFTSFLLSGLGGAADFDKDQTIGTSELFKHVRTETLKWCIDSGKTQTPLLYPRDAKDHPLARCSETAGLDEKRLGAYLESLNRKLKELHGTSATAAATDALLRKIRDAERRLRELQPMVDVPGETPLEKLFNVERQLGQVNDRIEKQLQTKTKAHPDVAKLMLEKRQVERILSLLVTPAAEYVLERDDELEAKHQELLRYYKPGAEEVKRIVRQLEENREAALRVRGHAARTASPRCRELLFLSFLTPEAGKDQHVNPVLKWVGQKTRLPREIWHRRTGMELVLIEPGEFRMGSNDGSDHEKPVHTVRITRPFYLGKYEVTQEQYQRVVGTNPGEFKGPANPVENVSWHDATAFCKALGGELPTEAEWEYACRAGSTKKYGLVDEESEVGDHAWHSGNSDRKAHPVGRKKPNAWGLYDMLGNVWEWCADWYGEDYYRQSPAEDPTGPAGGSSRVLRGGSWTRAPSYCRAAPRDWSTPTYRYNGYGFRILLRDF